MWACERFHANLYGAEFELMTDYKPLECTFSPKSKTCARIERWLLRLQPYKFSIKYIPGPKNIADSLSRLLHPTSNSKEKNQTDEYVTWVAQRRTEFPSAPWQHLAADLLGPLPSGDYICVVVDYYSRFFEMAFTKLITTDKIVSLMSKMFVTHGLPCSLRTVNRPQFISDHFKGCLEKNGIEHRRTRPLRPQANGEIERQNCTILKRLRIAQAEGRDWRSQMDDFLMMYRSTPH